MPSTCKIDSCERPVHLRDWCRRHYLRWIRYSSPTAGAPLREPPPEDGLCTIKDCTKTHKARGMCGAHYVLWRTKGSPIPGKPLAGEKHYKWTGNDASYEAIHLRIYKAKGKASSYRCQHCENGARHWAYDHQDKNQRYGTNKGHTLVYSLSLDHYIPLCGSCHKVLDQKRLTDAS